MRLHAELKHALDSNAIWAADMATREFVFRLCFARPVPGAGNSKTITTNKLLDHHLIGKFATGVWHQAMQACLVQGLITSLVCVVLAGVSEHIHER